MLDGHLVEQIIAEFTSLFFMKDFVILNPRYNRAGYEKELSDLLLVLEDECIVISVKATDQKPKPKTKLKRWLTKKTLEGMKQAKGGIAWLSKVSCAGKNLWEEMREFQANSLRLVCGIVLLECSQEPYQPIKFPIPKFESEVPIHFLSLNDFLNIVKWLGSIGDVFNYFSRRAGIRDLFTGINQEQPVFAFYQLISRDLSGLTLMCDSEREELRDRGRLHLMESNRDYKERDRRAMYVNAIVHQLHTRHPNIEQCVPEELQHFVEPLERRSSYLKMASRLNSLPMSNKAWLGQKLRKLSEELRESGSLSCFAYQRLESDFAFVFACFSKLSRPERMRYIAKMLPAALNRYQVAEGLGVAVDADDTESGFDLVWGRYPAEFTERYKKLGERLFPEPIECLFADPFGNARPYTPT